MVYVRMYIKKLKRFSRFHNFLFSFFIPSTMKCLFLIFSIVKLLRTKETTATTTKYQFFLLADFIFFFAVLRFFKPPIFSSCIFYYFINIFFATSIFCMYLEKLKGWCRFQNFLVFAFD